MTESAIIAAMRGIATSPAARGLLDDAAVLDIGGQSLVLTHDMLVQGRHFRDLDPAASVAWKLVAANMSDLAAKGAAPLGVLIGYGMARGDAWDADFAAGLADALRQFAVPLLGGDTVAMPHGGPATLGLTAIGLAPACGAPSRSGAKPGDELWVSACVGDAGAGLTQNAAAASDAARALAHAYLYPQPNVALGQALAPFVSAMTDISDGLLLDAQHIADASHCTMMIALDTVPLSPALRAVHGNTHATRLAAVSAGDDYCLLFTAPPSERAAIMTAAVAHGSTATRIGQCAPRTMDAIMLSDDGMPCPLPVTLGYEHRPAG